MRGAPPRNAARRDKEYEKQDASAKGDAITYPKYSQEAGTVVLIARSAMSSRETLAMNPARLSTRRPFSSSDS
ncbi:hypothetical protein, partial [Streptomyces californicus]